MKPILPISLCLSLVPCAVRGQLLVDTPVQTGGNTCLVLSRGEIDLTGITASPSSYIDLTDVRLSSRTPVGQLRLHGENHLSVPEAQNLYLRDGDTYLESDLHLTGNLDETFGGVLRSDNGSVLRKEVSVSAQSLTSTGLGFSLQTDKGKTVDLELHLSPRILSLDPPTALRGAVFETAPDRLGLRQPYLYYSVYGMDNWKPADESTWEVVGDWACLRAGALPLVAALTAFEEPTLFFPAAITPNGDGINDRFEIHTARNYPDSRLVVLNPSGRTVFDASPYLNDFDGAGLPAGTYYYVFYTNKNGKPYRRATLTLLR